MPRRFRVTRLGDFWKFLITNCLTKVTQIFCDFLGYFETHLFEPKTAVVTYLATFEKIRLLFILTSGHTALTSDQS